MYEERQGKEEAWSKKKLSNEGACKKKCSDINLIDRKCRSSLWGENPPNCSALTKI